MNDKQRKTSGLSAMLLASAMGMNLDPALTNSQIVSLPTLPLKIVDPEIKKARILRKKLRRKMRNDIKFGRIKAMKILNERRRNSKTNT